MVQVNVGDSVSALREITTVNLTPADTIVTLLSGVREHFRYVEIAVKQCRNGGIDCKVHGLQVSQREEYLINSCTICMRDVVNELLTVYWYLGVEEMPLSL